MKQRRRIYYTESQKAIMWERWRKGDSLQQIAQLFDRNHSSVQRILSKTGGIQPAQCRRSDCLHSRFCLCLGWTAYTLLVLNGAVVGMPRQDNSLLGPHN
jgi:hypothetical protein